MAIKINPKNKGKLHSDLGVPQDKPIPADKIEAATHSKSKAVRKRAVFAENARKWHGKGFRSSMKGT